MLKSSIITYDGLPISSGGGHRLHTRSPLIALDQARDFIVSCTDASHPQDASLEVLTGENIPVEFSGPLIKKLTAELGAPNRQRFCGAKNIEHCWRLAEQQIYAHVALIEQAKPLPVHPYKLQPVAVAALFKFHLLDPHSRGVFPDQHPACYGNFSPSQGQLLGESMLYTRISERSTFSLFLNFPFEEVSESFLRAAGFVQAHLPFPLSANHWRQWRLSKQEKSYVSRKITLPDTHA